MLYFTNIVLSVIACCLINFAKCLSTDEKLPVNAAVEVRPLRIKDMGKTSRRRLCLVPRTQVEENGRKVFGCTWCSNYSFNLKKCILDKCPCKVKEKCKTS